MRLFSVGEEFRRRFIVLKINIVRKIRGQELREREFLALFFLAGGTRGRKYFVRGAVSGSKIF